MNIYEKENKKTLDSMNDLNFDDEIVSIECLGEDECIDIEVSNDHLFYANEILTKNSYGIPATADSMIIQGQDEDDMVYKNEIKWKCVKNRLGGRVGDTGKFYYDGRSLKIYDECELDQWIADAQRTNDERSLFEREV